MGNGHAAGNALRQIANVRFYELVEIGRAVGVFWGFSFVAGVKFYVEPRV
jgi:hypothetical protein